MAGGFTDAIMPNISGNVKLASPSISGDVRGGDGRTTMWGNIKGDIERQDDLQVELHKRDTEAATQAEVEEILYLN